MSDPIGPHSSRRPLRRRAVRRSPVCALIVAFTSGALSVTGFAGFLGNAAASAGTLHGSTSSLSKQATPQTITFTSTPPTNATVGTTYVVSATGGGSVAPVKFSIDASSTSGTCTIHGSTVSFTAGGSCVIDAHQAGTSNYAAAAEVQQEVAVTATPQTITFTSTPPTNATVGTTYVVSATGGGSSKNVKFSIDAFSTPGTCTIHGSTVSFTAAGTCVIDANQAGTSNYAAAAQVQQDIAVTATPQTITFTSTPPTNATAGTTYVVSATGGGSPNPVTFSIDPTSTSGTCAIGGSTVSFTAGGSCVIDANQAGTSNYAAAAQVQQDIAVTGPTIAQTITFTSTPPANGIVGTTYLVSATGGESGNPVTFSIDPTSTSGTCAIGGPTVSFTVSGTCVIDANQAGTSTYVTAAQVQQWITVTPPPGIAAAIPLGFYAGPADPQGVADDASITGTHPTIASDYLPISSGWIGIDGAGGSLNWLLDAYQGTGYTLALGIPMIPTNSSGKAQGTLAGGAAGNYDSYFVTLARTLVAAGFSNAYLRLGYEFNGDWYPWQVDNAAKAANFVAYWQNIVNSMRSVPGAAFEFVWNPSGGFYNSYSPTTAYPGNAYVDYIGIDTYDDFWGTPFTPQASWNNLLTQPWGLDWLASFAASVSKPLCLPEWGVSNDPNGLGDDPYFVNQLATWLAANNAAWTSYFAAATTAGDYNITDGNFPNALAAFEADFG